MFVIITVLIRSSQPTYESLTGSSVDEGDGVGRRGRGAAGEQDEDDEQHPDQAQDWNGEF